MARFNDTTLRDAPWSTKYPYWFSAAMISSCKPLFNKCEDNYEVEALLKKAGVLNADCYTDTESCEMVVLFKQRKHGTAFLSRLNKYLDDRRQMMADLKL